MSYLLDTNVVSEWRQTSPDPGLLEWFDCVPLEDLFVSVITFGEIRRGIARLQLRGDDRQAAAYELWLSSVKSLFGDRVVPVTAEVAEEWGCCDTGGPVSMADGLIAATAKVRGWTVVTRNVKDFGGTGVRLLNPFSGSY